MRMLFFVWAQNKRQFWIAGLISTLLIATLSAHAQAEESSPIFRGQFFDRAGTSVPGGHLLFQGPEEYPLQFEVTESGNFEYSAADFHPYEIYQVAYTDSTDRVICTMDEWQFKPEEYDQQFDAFQNVNKFNLTIAFWDTGELIPSENKQTRMGFYAKKVRNPWWYEPLSLSIPQYLFSAQICFNFGHNWTTNSNALGGVVGHSPGLNVAGAYRFGYPQKSKTGGSAITFREISLSYAFNGYDINQAFESGRTADVQFHRITAAYSFGRMSSDLKRHFAGGPAVSWGGIYDGSTPLEYMDRSFGMIGFGAQGKVIRRVAHAMGKDWGLHAQLELMYYAADRGENDFWYGLAPSLSMGVIIY